MRYNFHLWKVGTKKKYEDFLQGDNAAKAARDWAKRHGDAKFSYRASKEGFYVLERVA